MTAETIITTATTIAVRALIDGIAALRENAKAEERAEIDRMVAHLHETAPEPVASSLDGITEAHLARVRNAAAFPELTALAAQDTARRRLAVARLQAGMDPVEGEDPDQ